MGFRTPAGRITTTQSFKTIQIPRLVRGKPDAWDPQICFQWGQQFIANPDLVHRLAVGGPLAEAPKPNWYGGDFHGYSDWPGMEGPVRIRR